MRYTSKAVIRLATLACEFTRDMFTFGHRHDTAARAVVYTSGDGQCEWRGRDASQMVAAYYSSAALRWAELADTISKLHPELLAAAQSLGYTGDPRPVRLARQQGLHEGQRRFSLHQACNATAVVGEQRVLGLTNRAEIIAWCGGRAPDDPGSDVLYYPAADGTRGVLILGCTLELTRRGFRAFRQPPSPVDAPASATSYVR